MLVVLLFVVSICTVSAQQYNAAQYIEKHKNLAQKLMNEEGVPASVILAVAMHESANGGSKIAKHLNNHFGIKGKNHSRKIRSSYKGYGSVKESYNDFVTYLKKRSRTQGLFDTNPKSNSRLWVRSIARTGYSQTGSWSTQVLATIKRHNLTIYDKPDNQRVAASEQKASAEEIAVSKRSKQDTTPSIYRVKSGDNLWTIARRKNTTVAHLKSINKLSSTKLSIGQKLKI